MQNDLKLAIRATPKDATNQEYVRWMRGPVETALYAVRNDPKALALLASACEPAENAKDMLKPSPVNPWWQRTLAGASETPWQKFMASPAHRIMALLAYRPKTFRGYASNAVPDWPGLSKLSDEDAKVFSLYVCAHGKILWHDIDSDGVDVLREHATEHAKQVQDALQWLMEAIENGAGATTSRPNADEGGYLTPRELADRFGVDPENARKALARWRANHAGGDGFIENQDARSKEPRFAYRVQDVRSVMARLSDLAERRQLRRKKSSGRLPSRE